MHIGYIPNRRYLRHMCALDILIAYRTSARTFQTGPSGRDVCPQTPDTGASDQASSIGDHRSAETARCGCRHGIEPSLHGDEGSGKILVIDDNKLHARMYAVKCEDEG